MSINCSAIVIMGASGDLAKRKLIPALIALFENGTIAGDCMVLGNGRSDYTDESFREHIGLPAELSDNVYYHQGMDGLFDRVKGLGDFNKIIVFMALPPAAYGNTAEALYREGFQDNVRIIIEKPFGVNYDSARKLNDHLKKFYSETQIYRIDHYLAKEAVQNILVFRFANSIFFPVWNSSNIESIQINAFEEIGVESRGAYFDKSGIIRDMVQNHLLQLLALLTMEAPVSLDPESIRHQKLNILRALSIKDCHIQQYEGYRSEETIPDDSETETYAELKMNIDTYRWTGMPVYIRTGKAVGRKLTNIVISFKKVPQLLFNKDGKLDNNRIIFHIQPQSGITIGHSTKIPGSDMDITTTDMDFCYATSFDGTVPEAYQKLLQDAMKGDQTLFVSAEETELSWKKIAPYLDMGSPLIYPKGQIPLSQMEVNWVDPDKYANSCRF
ncbi:MAG: glucose-6-phosphate dehydrogenase [Spirochaetaceae bacterium 4572_59]|nr:MAG: glucose-6-phosphate dehydrogenase [Spirochaetaceae bacterium 4572_59]